MSSPEAFFSYARADWEIAEKIASELRNAGVSIWIDQSEIGVGNPWPIEITEAIKNSEYFIVILSPSSSASDAVLNEINQAVKMKKKIRPVMIEKCDLPFQVGTLHYIDLTSNYEAGIDKLVKSLNLNHDPILKDDRPAQNKSDPNQLNKLDKKKGSQNVFRNKAFLLLGGLVLICLTGYYIYNHVVAKYKKQIKNGQIGIIITDFSEGASGVLPNDRTITQKIIDELQHDLSTLTGNMKEKDRLEIKVIPIKQVIDPTNGVDEATKICNDYEATIVIWGWYSKSTTNVLLNTHFQIANGPLLKRILSDKDADAVTDVVSTLPLGDKVREQNYKLADLESFSLHASVAETISILTQFTLGIIHYKRKAFNEAIAFLNAAKEKALLKRDFDGIDCIYFFLGNSLYYNSKIIENKLKAVESFEQALKIVEKNNKNKPPYLHKLYNNLGVLYAQLGSSKFEKAKNNFTKAIQVFPKYAEAYFNIGMINYQQKNVEKSIANFKSVLELVPGSQEARKLLAILYKEKSQQDSALLQIKKVDYIESQKNSKSKEQDDKNYYEARIAALKDSVSKYYGDYMAYSGGSIILMGRAEQKHQQHLMKLAQVYKEIGNLTVAVELWEKAIKISPGFILAHQELIKAYGQIGNTKKEALSLFRLGAAYFDQLFCYYTMKEVDRDKRIDDARRCLQLALQKDHQLTKARHKLGMLEFNLHNEEKAQKLFATLVDIDSSLAIGYYMLASTLLLQRDTTEALLYFSKTLQLDSGNFLTHFKVGNVYFSQHKWQAGISSYEKAKRFDYYKYKYDKCRSDYNVDIDNFEVDEALSYNLGACYFELGMYEKATENLIRIGKNSNHIEAFKKLIRIYEISDKQSELIEAFLSLARAYYRSDSLKQAEIILRKAKVLAPNDETVVTYLGIVLQRLGRIVDAHSEYNNAIYINPSNFTALYRLGAMMYNTKDYSASILTLEKAKVVNPSNIVAQYILGLAYKRTGNSKKAIEEWNIALSDSNYAYEFSDYDADMRIGTEAWDCKLAILFSLGATYKEAGDTRNAKKYFQMVTSTKGDYSNAATDLKKQARLQLKRLALQNK